jgi:NAD(P)H-hydrate epimerase
MDPSRIALYPLRAVGEVPAISADQMREIDRLAIEDAGLSLLQMMENAGRALAQVTRDYTAPTASDAPEPGILIFAGRGNNGGGAIAAARNLRNWGLDPQIVLASPPGQLGEAAATQHHTLHRDGARAIWPGAPDFDEHFSAMLENAAVVIDGLVGYGLRGALHGDVALLVDAILDQAPPLVISLDVPSGVEATSGDIYSTAIVATTTLTLALPKTGLIEGDAAAAVGDLLLADLGIPGYVTERLNLGVPPDLFADGAIVRLISPP